MRQQLKIAKMADWAQKGSTPKIVFNQYELKTMQRAILNCLQVSDVIANLPTGFGKSLLFQYPASLQKKNYRCIMVIVPLKALLWDTVRQARQLSISAQEINNSVIDNYYRNQTLPQMLVTTPQKIFATENTQNFIQSLYSLRKIRLVAIDQCHCISEWGHDFRPAYLRLQQLKQKLSGVRLLAISATITPESRSDLTRRLFLYNANYFQASYHRSNLYYGVIKCPQKLLISKVIIDYLKFKEYIQKQGIIYCQTIASAEQLQKQLSCYIKVGLFHSQLSENRRRQIYDGFINGTIKTIVGTICFGMGINKKDIRYVINVGISKSPQNYYQQSGRAGRDGKQASCIIIQFPNQTRSHHFLISQGKVTNKQKGHQLAKLQQMKQYSKQLVECRRKLLFRFLGQNFNEQLCNKMCDLCRQQKDKVIIKKIDLFESIKNILQCLQESKLKFTKKQLCSYLKGKPVKCTHRGKQSQLVLGEQIKGIFKNQSQQMIEQIVQAMVSRNILVSQINKKKTRYCIPYYKAANRNSTRKFTQFTLTIKQVPAPKRQPTPKKTSQFQFKPNNRFQKFLQKKGLPAQRKSTKSLQQLIPKKVIIPQNQGFIQAQVIKQKENYQSFYLDLFGDDFMDEKVDHVEQREGQGEGEGEALEPGVSQEVICQNQMWDEPQYLDLPSKEEDDCKIDNPAENDCPSKQNILQKTILVQQKLKRDKISQSYNYDQLS